MNSASMSYDHNEDGPSQEELDAIAHNPQTIDDLTPEEQAQIIEDYAKQSLFLTKEEITSILNEVLQERVYTQGLKKGIETLSQTSPTKTVIKNPYLDPGTL